MFNSYYLGLFIHFGMGRLGSRWQVLFLVTDDADDENELEAYILLSYYMYWMFRCLYILWVICSEDGCIDYSDFCIKLLWYLFDAILFYVASLCIFFSIVFYPCAVSNTIDSAVLNYLSDRPWLQGTLYSAPFLCLVQESWEVVTFGIRALVNRFYPTLADVTTYERRNCILMDDYYI